MDGMNFDNLWAEDGPPALLSDDSNSNPWDPEMQRYFRGDNSNPPDFEKVQAAMAVGGLAVTMLSLVPGFNIALYGVGAIAAGYGVLDIYEKNGG